MRFRKQTTFNARDTKFMVDEVTGRLVILNGVRRRCDIVISKLSAFGTCGATKADLVTAINRRARNDYSGGDISHAVKRLILEGAIVAIPPKKGETEWRFRVGKAQLNLWDNLDKDIV